MKKNRFSFIQIEGAWCLYEKLIRMDGNKEKILAELIIKIRFGVASEEEVQRVEAWLKERKENQEVYDRIISGKGIVEYLEKEKKVEAEVDLDVISQQIQAKMKIKHAAKRRRLMGWFTGVAACLIGVVVMSLWEKESDEVIPLAEKEKEQLVEEKVRLVLSSGETIGLTQETVDSIRLEQSTIIRQEDQLSYMRNDNFKEDTVEERNKIETMVGGEYSFILSDGTRVWLNAESELDFPVNFLAKERVVRLKGEAYFEVHPDAEHPFIVETKEVRTRVLGTSFNIKAYDNEEAIWTTLLTGKVEVTGKGNKQESVVLVPGMQSSWEKNTQKMSVKQVNTEHFIAWKNGLFMFDNEDISTVIRVLERWYGVRFVYEQPGNRRHTFSGCLSKDDTLESTLETLTFTGGPLFKIENDVVYIIDK